MVFNTVINKVRKLLHPAAPATNRGSGRGILLFEHTGDVIKAEACLKDAGFSIAVKAPPPTLRTGCDLVIEYPLVQGPAVQLALAGCNITPLDSVAVSSELLEPVSVYQRTDYGNYLMIRAANMKITIDKITGSIVNVSGGGCPDVPYLASILIGCNIFNAEPPLKQGQTLCGYALQLAFDEAKQCLG